MSLLTLKASCRVVLPYHTHSGTLLRTSTTCTCIRNRHSRNPNCPSLEQPPTLFNVQPLITITRQPTSLLTLTQFFLYVLNSFKWEHNPVIRNSGYMMVRLRGRQCIHVLYTKKLPNEYCIHSLTTDARYFSIFISVALIYMCLSAT